MKNVHQTESSYDRAALNQLDAMFRNRFAEKADICRKSAKMKYALSAASKTGDGPGYPDGMVFLDSGFRQPLVMMEAKRPNAMGEALSDLEHYWRAMNDKGVYVPFILGISGTESDLYFVSKSGDMKPILDEKGLVYNPRIEKLDEHILRDIHFSQISKISPVGSTGLSFEQVAKFSQQINHRMHDLAIKEEDRPKIFTSFLIACLDASFEGQITEALRECSTAIEESDYACVADNYRASFNACIDRVIRAKDLKFDEGRFHISAGSEARAFLDILLCASDPSIVGSESKSFIRSLMDSTNVLGEAYEVFYTYTKGNDIGQYFTPRHAVELVIFLIEKLRNRGISADDIIYDPACGVGGFLVLSMLHALANIPAHEHREFLEVLGNRIFGNDAESWATDIAKINLLLRGDGRSGIVRGSALDKDYRDASPIKKRFAQGLRQKDGSFDGVQVKPTICLLNPPFPSKKSKFKSYDFIDHCVDVADSGAWIGAIIPMSVINGSGKAEREFRGRILKSCQLRAVVELPPDLFEPKASINTAILILEKFSGGHDRFTRTIFASCTKDGLSMHKGDKARVRKPGEEDSFEALKREWLQHRQDIPKLFTVREFSEDADFSELMSGEEWAPGAFLNDDEADFSQAEMDRVIMRIVAERDFAASLFGIGGKW